MVRIYMQKQYVKDKKVIYDTIGYFDNTVAAAVRNGEYELTDSDRSLIANEGSILKVSKDVITTKYGDISLRDLSIETKVFLLMRYLKATGDKSIVNVSNTGKAFARVLCEAERLETDVFWTSKYFAETWFTADMYVLVNDSNTPVNLAETSIFHAFGAFGNSFNITNDTRIEFKSCDAEYDLFFTSSRADLIMKDNMQKQKFMHDLKKAVADGSIKVTATKLDTYDDVCDGNIQILVADSKNAADISEKVDENKRPYIIFYDGDNLIESLFCMQTENCPINEIALCLSEGGNTEKCDYRLVEKEIPASDENTARFSFNVEDNTLRLGKREKLDFSELQL